jgi:hypothetical protein
MTQALRVALWVPTEDPPDNTGDGILTKAAQLAAKVLPTRFAPGGGGAGGGIEEAPFDSKTYGRFNGFWKEVAAGGSGGGLPEAPQDGSPYLRQDAAWVPFPAVIDAGTY